MTYPLDGFIPFILTFESSNEQAVDLLSSPESFSLILAATCVYDTDVSRDAWRNELNERGELVAKASFWSPPSEGSSGYVEKMKGAATGSKTYHGEIRVPKDAVIQFEFPTIKYMVSWSLTILQPTRGY